jgi:hypothetical protein
VNNPVFLLPWIISRGVKRSNFRLLAFVPFRGGFVPIPGGYVLFGHAFVHFSKGFVPF